MVDEAVEKGGKIVTGGHKLTNGEYSKGYFYEPTLLTNVNSSSKVMVEECFGPALPVVPVADLDEAVERANSTSFGLGACVWTRNDSRLKSFEDRIQSGMLWENSAPITVPEASFGGVKDSGVGRELGIYGLLEYLEVKSIRRLVD
jgi:acyl-CoA reductase-like NAD-dependent aldehyde dehydrogenase